jgi:hypothetical protein
LPENPSQSDITETSATITGLVNDTAYYVWVETVNPGGTKLSERKAITLDLPAPVPELGPGNGRIIVNWEPIASADFYNVYFSTDTTLPENPSQSDITGTSVTITRLINDITYYVWVEAVNAGGNALSSCAMETPMASAAPMLSWSGVWANSGENRYTSNSVGVGSDTWELLTISGPCIVVVTLTASGESGDYGYASNLDGSPSRSSYRFRVRGLESYVYSYSVPTGTHYLYFGYYEDGSFNGKVTVEVNVLDETAMSGAPSFSWYGLWTRNTVNKYTSRFDTSNVTGSGFGTWELLAITTSGACTVVVTLTASGESSDYGYASNLDESLSRSSYRFRVTGTGSYVYPYSVPAGTHYLYFMYYGDSSNGSVTVEVSVTGQ